MLRDAAAIRPCPGTHPATAEGKNLAQLDVGRRSCPPQRSTGLELQLLIIQLNRDGKTQFLAL